MANDDLCYFSAAELAHRLRQQKVSSVEVIDALKERIDRLNPRLNAYFTLDLENARRDAEMKHRMRKEHPHGDLGPLHGVPVAIKDDLEVKGLRCTDGSRLCLGYVPDFDDVTVARLKKAGAIVLGKTHEPEFGHKGTTDNRLGEDGKKVTTVTPWHLGRTSGGSSGGSAAAVAAGLAYLALGTDIAGSVRIPASCCGIVAIKPTFGLVPRVPSGNAFTLWASGPLGRRVADVALALQVLAGPHPGDRFSLPHLPHDAFRLDGPLPELKILWCPNPTGVEPEPEVARAAHKALDDLARHSKRQVRVEEAKAPLIPADAADALIKSLTVLFRTGSLGECMEGAKLASLADFVSVADQMSPTYRDFVTPAWEVTLKEYLLAQAAVTDFCEKTAPALFAGYDLIATPTLAVPPFDKDLPLGPEAVSGRKIDARMGWAFTWPFNLTGEPAVSLPCGWTEKENLPIGLQLVGRRGQDGLVLRAAAAVERLVSPTYRRPPPNPPGTK
jgi:Asp-tRNA(Asn)/Glu-tRNA(Gln) amidotransferase A subunit family amidase